MASLPIPDDLLVDILLRLPTPADLVRATAACVSFRRIAADRSFLRRYRKLHAPLFLGFLDRHKGFYPAIAPHPSASAANAVSLAADFSFSFLPAPASDWVVRDIRDARVLLDKCPQDNIDKVVFPDLVVCDPLHRRYLLIPPIPARLTATVEQPLWIERQCFYQTFLASPSGNNELSAAEDAPFSVIWMGQCTTKLVAFVFSSSTGQWRAISAESWNDSIAGLLSWTGFPLLCWRQYAYGCFYWVTDCKKKLFVFDTHRMELSIAERPLHARGLPGVDIAIVEAGEGRLGMFVRPRYTNCLDYSIRHNNCVSWQYERTVSLDFIFSVMGSAGKHLFLFQRENTSCFSLDINTFQLERVLSSDSCMPYVHTYSNFPPSLLSTPTISSGVEEGVKKEMLEQGCAANSSAESSQSE